MMNSSFAPEHNAEITRAGYTGTSVEGFHSRRQNQVEKKNIMVYRTVGLNNSVFFRNEISIVCRP